MTEPAVLVTGAASGIGRATALLCVSRGVAVAATDRDQDGLGSLADEAKAFRGRLLTLPGDVTFEPDVERIVAEASDVLGTLVRVVASAGIEINAAPHELPAADWDRVLQTNLTGTFLTCRVALRSMVDAQVGGSIVCLSSPAAFVGFAGGGNAAYAASKGGVSALVRTLAIDYARYGIRVNAVVPGATDTPMLLSAVPAQERAAARDELVERAAHEVPLGRLAQPAEIAQAVAWLLSDQASYVTGSHLVCDGGLLAKSANTF
jgi:NAD(P)-dependent dehydrogenase (short-subunit alcohol dehydrogenase family)